MTKGKSNQGSRIQQAFYSLIPESDLPKVHLKLGRVLNELMQRLEESDENALDEATIFVPHL
jgi:predicted ATPase